MKKINWGIIGLGTVAMQFAKGFKSVKNSKLLGIASKSQKKIEEFKKDFDISEEHCFGNYEDLLKNKDIHIVYVALPTFLHFKWIINCLKEGKKVLVEKPATMNSLEIENIKKNFFNEKTFFTEAFMYLYHPQIKKTLELVKSGDIGELISMESFFGRDILTKKNFLGFRKRKKIDPENRLYNKKLGGGAILDLGCYPVSFSTLLGSIKSTISFNKIEILNKKKEIGVTGVDIDSYIELKFQNNFQSNIGASFTKNLGNQTKIIGSKGEILIKDTWTALPSQIVIKKDNEENIININSNENIYSYEIEAVSQSIIDKKTKANYPGLTIDDTILNMKIIDNWIN